MTGCDAYQIDCERRSQGALGPAEAAALDEHLSGCAGCRAFDDVARRVDVMIHADAGRAAAPVDWTRMRKRLDRRRLKARGVVIAAVAGAAAAHVSRALEYDYSISRLVETLVPGMVLVAAIALFYVRRFDSQLNLARTSSGDLFEILRRQLDRRVSRYRTETVLFPLVGIAILVNAVRQDVSAWGLLDVALGLVALAAGACTYLVWLPRARRERAALE